MCAYMRREGLKQAVIFLGLFGGYFNKGDSWYRDSCGMDGMREDDRKPVGRHRKV